MDQGTLLKRVVLASLIGATGRSSYCLFAGIVSALSALWISLLARRRSQQGLVPAQTAA